jgi:hypothetical protein
VHLRITDTAVQTKASSTRPCFEMIKGENFGTLYAIELETVVVSFGQATADQLSIIRNPNLNW